ncbi:MAG: response regulator [Vicinamibacterales bacterium]
MPHLFSHADQTPPAHALIVEDEVETLELLSEFCRKQGLHVAGARDGRAAIAQITRTPAHFDIVITDVNLPGADGFEVLNAARQSNPSCYVVIITGYATLDSAVRAVREGAYDYLPKPFALGQLEIVLRRIRDRMMLERENRELLKRQSETARHPGTQAVDLSTRLLAIEDRLERIETLLRRE